MADKDDKDTSFGGSQGNRGGGSTSGGSTSSGSSGGGYQGARSDSGSSGRGGVGSTGGGGSNYGGSPGGNNSPGYGWGGGGGGSSYAGQDRAPSAASSNRNSGGGAASPGGSHGAERGRDFSLGSSPSSTPTGFSSAAGGGSKSTPVSSLPDSFNDQRFGGLPKGFNTDRFGYDDVRAATAATGPASPTQYTPGRFGMAVPTPTGMTPAEALKAIDESMADPLAGLPRDYRRPAQRQSLADEQAPVDFRDPFDGSTLQPAKMTERAALGTTNPATGLPARADAPGMSMAGTERAPAAPTPTGYNPSTGIAGATIDPNQFSNPSMYGSAARAAENQSMRDLANMNVPGTSMAGTEGAPRGLGMSMAGTETAPAHAGVGPTGFSLDNRSRMTPAMGGVHSAVYGPSETQMASSSAARASELASMDKLGHYNIREKVKSVEAGTTDPYSRMVEGGPVDYNKGLSDGSMTLGDIKDLQRGMLAKGYNSTAVGAYQTIDTTLDAAAKRLGLTDDTVMTEAVWDQIGDNLIDNRIERAKAANGGVLTAEGLAHELAGEWAAFSTPRTGRGRYDKVGTNRASVPADQVTALADDFIKGGYGSPTAGTGTTATAGTGTTTPATVPTPSPAPRGTEAAAGGTVTTPAAPPGTQNFPTTPPAQPQAPGFPSFKTPATGYVRSGLGTVLGLAIDAGLSVAGGPVALAANGGSLLLTGDSVGGTIADMIGGKYGPNQYAPGRDDKYSGDRAGGAGSGGQNTRGVNAPVTTSKTPTVKPGETTTTEDDETKLPYEEAFVAKYIDRPSAAERWGKLTKVSNYVT